MSIFNSANAVCPECGETVEISWAASVNADRRPDLRLAILDSSFQAEPCPICESTMRLPPHITYLDVARGHWILVEDVTELSRWPALEEEADRLFSDSFGAKAPSMAKDIGTGMQKRLVFGWPALREKLFCAELGLDDVELELLKVAVIRGVDDVPIGEDLALRLVAGDSETLTFDVTDDDTEERVATTEVPRSLYDDIVGDTDAWAPLREQLVTETFVDVARFMVG